MLKWNEWEIANEDARLLKNQQDLDAVITQLAPNVN